MRRADGDTDAVGRSGLRGRIGPMALTAIVLTATATAGALAADDPPGQRTPGKATVTGAAADIPAAIDASNGRGPYLRGLAALEKGDNDAAIAHFDEAIRLDPHGALAFHHRGRARFAKQELDKALADLDEAIRLDPQYAPAYENRARIWDARGRHDKAYADLAESVRLDAQRVCEGPAKPPGRVLSEHRGDGPGPLPVLAEHPTNPPESAPRTPSQNGSGSNKAASPVLDEGPPIAPITRILADDSVIGDRARDGFDDRGEATPAAEHPAFAPPDRDLAPARDDDVIRALDSLESAAPPELLPGQSFTQRAAAELERGEIDRAFLDLDEAIRLDPRDAAAYALRGAARVKRGDVDRALADLDVAIELDPRNAAAFADRGAARLLNREIDKALVDFDEAIRLDPRNPTAYFHRGRVWMIKDQPDKAIADLTEAIRIVPDHARAHWNRAGAWFEKKDDEKALADVDEAIRLDPRNAGYYTARAGVRAKKRQYEKALADLDEATRLDPDHAVALNDRAWILATCPRARYRDGERAVAAARRACELTGWKVANLLDTMAAACAEAGDFDAAVRWQTEANDTFTDVKERPRGEARLRLYEAREPYRETGP